MELNFLNIADSPEDLQPLRQILAPFESAAQVQLAFRRVGWERAWHALLLEALEGKGPHVSQIGSTWGATMAMMDALRAFKEDEVTSLGGEQCFIPSAWHTARFAPRPEIWAIPWTIYTFVLFYRRDLLERASVDPETDFASPQGMRESFEKLSRKRIAPWAFPTLHPYADLVHISSSWARAGGGDFLREDGREPLFAHPEARAGLMDFFELYKYVPASLRGVSVDACTQAFARGDVAMLVGGVEVADELLASPHASPATRENLAMTTLPGVPWVGGDHLVVWKNVRADAQLEKGALDLVRFLSRLETQVQYFKLGDLLPARLDAYSEIEFSLDTTATTIQKVLETGRPHPPVRLWRRIEAFLDEMLLDIGNAVLRQSTQTASATAEQMLGEYEKKLSAMLKQ
jgi:ABC-type glycerol-3-phosphate transport system substrate-binding protein